MKENEMGQACGTYGEEEKCIGVFGGETYGKEIIWKTSAEIGK